MTSSPTTSKIARLGTQLSALILICFNLRTGFTSADSLLHEVETSLGLSLSDSGLFAVLPVLLLGVAAPLAPKLSRRFSPEKLILWFQAVAIAGILVRSYGGVIGLFGGMALLGLGMGVVGAEIPGLLKKDFPQYAGSAMGVYAALVSAGDAASSALAVPVSHWLRGWRQGLSIWALPVLAALVLWALYAEDQRERERAQPVLTHIGALLAQWRAWEVTLYYLSRVATAYLFYTWLPTLLLGRGYDAADAAFVLAIVTVSEIPAALGTSLLRRRLENQTALVCAAIPLTVLACWGILYFPRGLILPLAVLMGLSLGVLFSVGMTVLIDRARGPAHTLELSGMAQGFGFVGGGIIAWLGGFTVHAGGSFLGFSILYTAMSALGLFFGIRATRPGLIDGSDTSAAR